MIDPITRAVRVTRAADGCWIGVDPTSHRFCPACSAAESGERISIPTEVQSGTVAITFTPDPPEPPKIPWPWPDVSRVKISARFGDIRETFVRVKSGKWSGLETVIHWALGTWPDTEPRIAINDNGFVKLEACD